MTCHNRREQTLACLGRLFSQTLELNVFLVDDCSTDGTADAVKALFPHVRILTGSGDLFWCRGMRLAWEQAAPDDPDFYLWLNDDTHLFPGALVAMLSTWSAAGRPDTIVIGSCSDPATGQRTYGGQWRASGHPTDLRPVYPGTSAIPCDTFQSNLLLVPRAVFKRIGMLDNFSHAIGDTDYGYRAWKAGCQCLIAPGYLAACPANPSPTYWFKGPSRRERWRLMNGRKGLPFRDWLRFARRHGGPLWPKYWVRPYVRILLNL
jgi:GT2 family glycosyltransferase